MKRTLLPIGLACSALALYAAEDPGHPIDKKVAALSDAARSTVEMRTAFEQGNQLWDAELNRCYGELKKKLRPEAFAALQAAQRQWIVYRDAQLQFIGELYGHFDGTMYIPMRASAAMELTRKRALELKHDLDLLAEHGG